MKSVSYSERGAKFKKQNHKKDEKNNCEVAISQHIFFIFCNYSQSPKAKKRDIEERVAKLE